MIIIAYQMKNTMNDYTVKLILKCSSEEISISPYGINAYEKITGKNVLFTIIKSYNVRIIIVLEKFHIYIQQVIVRAENDIDPAQFS